MHVFLTLLVVHLLAMMAPGPDFFYCSQTAASRSHREALAAAAGVTLGTMFWAGITLLGLEIVFEKFAWLHETIFVLGGLYLLWMGVNLLRHALRKVQGIKGTAKPMQIEASVTRAFLRGLLTDLANAKALIYFTSIFAMMLTPEMDASFRWTLFGCLAVETFLWFLVVITVFGLPSVRHGYFKLSRWIDGAAGALFGGFGLALLWEAQ